MKSWLDFLASKNGDIHGGHAYSFGERPENYSDLASGSTITPLTDRGIIEFTGPDTDKLLQGQLTCDIQQLDEGKTLPGALCDVKGRMIATFLAYRPVPDTVLMIMHRGLVEKTLAALGKYAPFYKTALSEVSERYIVLGINHCAYNHPDLTALTVSATRKMLLADPDNAEHYWSTLSEQATPTGLPFWNYLAIVEGLGEVTPETSEEFIPQMLNLQHTDAISFRKGCYTGQEIVARMQYLGKLKRRTYRLLVHTDSPLPAGTPIHLEDTKNAGTVITAQATGSGVTQMLAVLTTEAAGASQLIFGEIQAETQVSPLPYDDKFKSE